MDRLSHLRGEAGGSRDSTLDTTSPPSEGFCTANESSSKYFSLSEVDSTFDISPIKDVSLASTAADSESTLTNTEELISNLPPIGNKSDMLDSYKIGKHIEAANILSGGVDIFEDNEENSYDGDELVIDDNVEDDKAGPEKHGEGMMVSSLLNEETDIGSKDSEVVLQIDGKNVDAIEISNGLYLYRKEGQEELAAVQIIDDDQQQPSFKFLKVRENAEGNLEVYEEIEIEVPKEVPAKEGKTMNKSTSSHVPIKDINKVISDIACNKVAERKIKVPAKEPISTTNEPEPDVNTEASPDSKSDLNLNGKMMKFSESRKSPVIGSFTPMTYHSTPSKEGKPLTKTMVDQQLHPSRHSDNVKKTIEVHTDITKQKTPEISVKKDVEDKVEEKDSSVVDEIVGKPSIPEENRTVPVEKSDEKKSAINVKDSNKSETEVESMNIVKPVEQDVYIPIPIEQDNVVDSTENINKEIIITDIPICQNEVSVHTNVDKSDSINNGKQNNKSPSKDTIIIDDKSQVEEKVLPDNKNDKQDYVVKNDEITKLDSEIKDEEVSINNEVSTVEPMEIDYDIKGGMEIKTQSDKPALEILKTDVKDDADNNELKSVEINLKDKEDKPKMEEGILIIDDDNAEGTVVTIDDIIDNTQANYKNEPTIGIGTQNNNFSIKTVEACVKSSEKNQTFVSNVVEIKEVSKPVASSQDDLTSLKVISDSNKEVNKDCSTTLLPVEIVSVSSIAPKVNQKQIERNKNIINLADNDTIETSVPIANKQILESKKNYKSQMNERCPMDIVKKAVESLPSSSLDKSKSSPKQLPINIYNKPKDMIFVDDRKPTQTHKEAIRLTMDENITEHKERSVIKSDYKAAQLVKGFQPQKYEKKEAQMGSKDNNTVQIKTVKEVGVSKVPNVESSKPNFPINQDASSTSIDSTKESVKSVVESKEKRAESYKVVESQSPINNNHTAVPFGQWTEANKQEFINKFKSKVPVNTSNSSQLKNSNDLNRRDVLKKIDSQRQTSNALSKTQEAHKLTVKNETAFLSKTNIISKDVVQGVTAKDEDIEAKSKPVSKPSATKTTSKQDTTSKINSKQDATSKITSKQDPTPKTIYKPDIAPKTICKPDIAPKTPNKPVHGTKSTMNSNKSEASERKGLTVTDLIDKTIEGMIQKTAPPLKTSQDDPKHSTSKETNMSRTTKYPQMYESIEQASKLDDIEMKMNELHGIPFIERPPHELPQPQLSKTEPKNCSKPEKDKQSVSSKTTKIPNLLPFPKKNQQKIVKESDVDLESDDEIIEHEPLTGDINTNKKDQLLKPSTNETLSSDTNIDKIAVDATKKEAFITEKDFDKFARRNSITYDNCLTVNFDAKKPHEVQTPTEKDFAPKTYTKHDNTRYETKSKPTYNKYLNINQTSQSVNISHLNKFGSVNEDPSSRNQSKVRKAYQSALTEKRQMECPITIIEDKPVKVVFMDNVEYIPGQLNVQGKELSPAKKPLAESIHEIGLCDSLDSDTFDAIDDSKSQEVKIKTKHQRKQVLTPVEEPELELIEPKDLGIEVSPKKKRRTDEDRIDKNLKYPVRKKFYQYPVPEDKTANIDLPKNLLKETVNRNDIMMTHKNPVSAIDSLVKAAELLETQTEKLNRSNAVNSPSNSSSQPDTSVKRGRGRPRKYPLPEGASEKKPSPQKKPRLIDAKPPKSVSTTDEDDSDDQIIKENWTMGKINENIVCPICNKLFRTENVVFKHVKHCTGPSPSRSDSDKRSPRRMRFSQESESKSADSKSDDMDIEDDLPLVRKETPKKRKSKDSSSKSDYKDEVTFIEDTPVKEKPDNKDERKHHEPRKLKTKIPQKNTDLICEFCGKTFRQLSYLVSHKMQHKKDEPKKIDKDAPTAIKSVHSCEVCKKEFRKLHHLVQHRIIHNPTSASVRSLRKSSELTDNSAGKEPSTSKQNQDPSAGFRCEPCDKSFRKLHHLVEHRETHDGKNSKQKPTPVPHPNLEKSEKPVSIHQCDVCKKTFRKLHYLIEHKEQHLETSSEKSDDKSVKSCLSTKDIIHECSHCYMVFPNEHSLNRHTVICSRKKRQSKQLKPAGDIEAVEETSEISKIEEKIDDVEALPTVVELTPNDNKQETLDVVEKTVVSKQMPEAAKNETEPKEEKDVEKQNVPQNVEIKSIEPHTLPAKREIVETESKKIETKSEVPAKVQKIDEKEVIHVQDTPKKKTPLKEKSTAMKRTKTPSAPAAVPVTKQDKLAPESSDDDEVRYMLNPKFKTENIVEEKVFMKVRAKKRSSLQIERPNSKDLVKRRTSLQHPPKIPRLKSKTEVISTVAVKNGTKIPEEPMPSTDSDDSETIKYSFPKTIPEKSVKSTKPPERTPKEAERKTPKKTIVEKRKTLSAIAKRKSLGKAVTARHKPSPVVKQIKRRTAEAEHRCDCGQLFSSAALLARHTSLAHTPPRVRRRRDPAPAPAPASAPARQPDKSDAKPTRKSTAKEPKTPSASKPKADKTVASTSTRRSAAHRGVPIPDKMKKLQQKIKS